MHADRQMVGQTDMTKLIGTFCEHEKVPRIHHHTKYLKNVKFKKIRGWTWNKEDYFYDIFMHVVLIVNPGTAEDLQVYTIKN
jgi:hypothetical protein